MKRILFALLLVGFCLPLAFAEDHHEFEDEDHEEIRLSSKQVAGFLKEHFPDRYQEMRELKEAEPEAFEEAYDEAREIAVEYMEMRREHPDMAEKFLEIEKSYDAIWHTVDKAEGKGKEDLAKVIRGKLNHIFDLRMEFEKAELAMLEDEVDAFRSELEEREEVREDIINEELEEILEDLEEGEEEDEEEEDDEEDDDGF